MSDSFAYQTLFMTKEAEMELAMRLFVELGVRELCHDPVGQSLKMSREFKQRWNERETFTKEKVECPTELDGA